MKKLSTPVFFIILSGFLCGFLPPKHSSLKIEPSTSELRQGQEVELKFIVVPNKDMMVTPEGPWKLTIKNQKGLDLDKSPYQNKSFNQAIPGFTLKTKVKDSTVSFDYEVKSFICTKDKKRCYPELHKGTFKK